nr:MAG TPA: hypothetical protein [Caudoviricetes sp.]
MPNSVSWNRKVYQIYNESRQLITRDCLKNIQMPRGCTRLARMYI